MSLLSDYPKQIKYIIGNEAAERYSFYGMKSILVVYMVQHLLMKEQNAVASYHLFTAACYLLPLLGAYLSDRYLGKYRTIMSLSIAYCLGHLVLALFETEIGTYWGLALIALGAGGIKPCVSAHVGDQFKANEKQKMRHIFELFYWMINFGSTFATLITPWTYEAYGPQVAFGIPGILMAIATFIFWLGRHHYVHVPPTGPNPHSFLRVMWSAFKSRIPGDFFAGATKEHPQEFVEGAKAFCGVMLLYVWISVFWALYDQSGSTWILQAQKMNLNFMGVQWNESQIQALNPIMIMSLIPIFSLFVFPRLEKWGLHITPIRKMVFGMFLCALGFVSVAIIQMAIDSGAQLNVAWQVLPYLIVAIAELLVSITGLEFAYTQASRSMKSTVMSFWLLTVFIGNMLTAWISKISYFPTASAEYFWFFAGLMGLTALVFTYFAKNYKMQNFMES